MKQLAVQNRHTLSAARKLVHKHYRRIVATPQPPELTDLFAVTFRPGSHTGSFHGRLLQRVGMGVLIALCYDKTNSTKPGRLTMPVRGFRARAYADGTVRYGGDGCVFSHDGSLSPWAYAGGKAISVLRNPSLLELALQLDAACKKTLERRCPVKLVPQLPKIWLGFAPDDSPAFEDTPALRRLAARELQMPVDRLGSNGPVLLDRLLRDMWHLQLIPASANGNSTGKVLVDAEFCTHARKALEIYEDFSDLVGTTTWNPARAVNPLKLENPARNILREFDIDTSRDFCQCFPDGLIEKMELALRQAIGPQHVRFSQVEVLDALTNAGEPLVAYTDSLATMRAKLSSAVSECVTDEDLRLAIRNPSKPLWVNGACQVQVVARRTGGTASDFLFDSDVLERRIEADLSSDAWSQKETRLARALVDPSITA